MKKIELGYDFLEPIQFIDQTHEIKLDNGLDVIVNITADVIISENIGASFYDDNQITVDIQNLEIDIIEVWDGEDLVELSESREKEIKKQILNNIE